jgi:hypothetical protein
MEPQTRVRDGKPPYRTARRIKDQVAQPPGTADVNGRRSSVAGWLAVTEERCDEGWRRLSIENRYHYTR